MRVQTTQHRSLGSGSTAKEHIQWRTTWPIRVVFPPFFGGFWLIVLTPAAEEKQRIRFATFTACDPRLDRATRIDFALYTASILGTQPLRQL